MAAMAAIAGSTDNRAITRRRMSALSRVKLWRIESNLGEKQKTRFRGIKVIFQNSGLEEREGKAGGNYISNDIQKSKSNPKRVKN